MIRAPLLAPACALVGAIAAEQHGFPLAGTFGAIVLALAAASYRFRHERARTVAFVTAFALIAGTFVSIALGHPKEITTERPTARYAATVAGDVRPGDDGEISVPLAIDGVGTVRATVRTALAPGDHIVVRGRLEPFDEPRNPGEPSMREIERDDGFAGRLASARVLAVTAPQAGDVRSWAARLRAAASRRIRAVIPEPSATILAGALWGERGTLPDDLHDAFQTTGTVHVLVTAGLHLGVIAAFATLLLSRLGMHRAATCGAVFAIVVTYAWFSGAHLPSQRAGVMIGVALLARACGARVTSWNALALAAIVVATVWPVAVTSASFALSFSCVTAIVLFAEPLATALHRLPVHERVREAIALTCATQLGTWPLTAAVFSTLAPYAIIANAMVVPLIAVVLSGGMLTLAVPAFAPMETLILLLVEGIVRNIAALPFAHASLATPPATALVVYDILALCAGVALRRGRGTPAFVLLIAAFGMVFCAGIIRPPHGLIVTSLDVGQADAAVIRTPNDRVILIDTGGELERGSGGTSNAERAGSRIVLAYLRRTGISAIDLMILTHPHGDHVGGAAPIIDAMPVRMVFDSGQAYGGRAYNDALREARTHRVPVIVAQRGIRWASGDGVVLDVLAPSIPFLADTGDDVNENSIVVMLHYHGFRELFMGDAGEASEARLLAGGEALHADVLKVGHHGSRYASTPEFAAAVRPGVAVISVGRHNTFGHPAQSTIDIWRRRGARVLRTDECGAISLSTPLPPTTMLPCDSIASRPEHS
jgi:competence protein ComEC